jgi:SHS2 domain-containing protein
MKPFEFLPHTADVKFLAYGKNLQEAFANCVLATTRIMTEDKVLSKEEKTIKIKSSSKQALLYDFLEEIIFLVDTEGFIVGEVKEIKINNLELEAVVVGDNGDNYEILTQIKSITYNDMFIKEEENSVTIQVVHDI